MKKRSDRSGVRETAKQRLKRAEQVRGRARGLAFCDALAFWRDCDVAACRRNHTCCGDPSACFTLRSRTVPEDILAIVRKTINARTTRR